MFAVALAVTVAGCRGDDEATVSHADSGDASTALAAGMPAGAIDPIAAPLMAAGAPGRAGLPVAALDGVDSFADLPDRGDLVGYPQERVVRRAGPYTWHRADISEAHAVAAIVDGVLSFTAPSGQLLKFQYERHVEHESGDWTWIGRLAGGSAAHDAILTFGAGAVYGTIAQQGGAPLKLEMADGASWLVETDQAARATQSRTSGRYDRPDFLLPPDLAVVQGLQAQAATVRSAEIGAAQTTVVDVVVGYTTGFETANKIFNNTLPVMTRLNFLVDVTNESYVNSDVDARVRLVHAMKVNYPDNTDNSTALSALTGSDGSTPDPDDIDPALRPLHQARDQYGADLVSLVRDFQHPEAVSCGVAWLIGGGQNFVHAGYAPFGMSVVSDGSDGGFFCEDTTFAHELGHNMGLAHDVETSKGEDGVLDPEDYGRYEYSFGYRTGPAEGDFYTVMAYSDQQVNGYRVFSNPDITSCGGFACGLIGQADNAQTLRQTIGIIASFRDTVVPVEPGVRVRDDIDGDGDSDLTWRNNSETRFAYWLLDGADVTDTRTFAAGSQWTVVARGDLNGDGRLDIVWTNGASLYLWTGDGTLFGSSRISAHPAGWNVFGAGDVDGDGKDDLIFRNVAQTQLAYWTMDGAEHVSTKVFGASSAWQLVIADDMSGDGMVDLVWSNGSRLALWTSTGSGFDSSDIRSHPAGWQLVDSGDIDGDGDADLVWRTTARDKFAYWLMDGDEHLGSRVWSVGPAWTLASVGDYNGDGLADLTWTSSTRVAQWVGNGQTFASANVRNYPQGWTLLR